ncbi:Type IV pilus biogenesis and competence protein PilQ precursor [compost metagenome]
MCSQLIVLACLLVGGCATDQIDVQNAQHLIDQGRQEEGLASLRQLADRDPTAYRLRYVQTRDGVIKDLLLQAQAARHAQNWEVARELYRKVLIIDPQQESASRGLSLIAAEQAVAAALQKAESAVKRGDANAAQRELRLALNLDPNHAQARQLLLEVERRLHQSNASDDPPINPRLLEEVTLELSDIGIKDLLQILSHTSGVNFVLDKDVAPDLHTTIYTRRTTVLSALDLILNMNQLAKKQLSDTAFLIYPDNEEKRNRYEELTVRTFYLKGADPSRVQDMIKTLAAPRILFIDEVQKMLVVRDRPSVIAAVERLVDLYDKPEPEVVLEVEIMEVNTDDKSNLGVQYPDSLGIGLKGDSDEGGKISFKDVRQLNSGSFQLYYPDPLAVINFKQTGGDARMLANPRIRVSNRQKAKILIGDKVPVITTTVNQTSSASMESVSYLDVGLRLEVQPEIYVNDDVTINVDLEVSNIAKEVRSSNGLLAYQIGTRNTNTMLRLRDGETQVLAGLLKDETQEATSELPGLGWIPGIGRLFSNKSKGNTRSEIVLQITPHIVRAAQIPTLDNSKFDSGTSERASTRPLRLTPAGRYSSSVIEKSP